MENTSTAEQSISAKTALRFVILIGVVSLFADMTYEGARSINGPFIAVLGASGTVVGIVSGLGESLSAFRFDSFQGISVTKPKAIGQLHFWVML